MSKQLEQELSAWMRRQADQTTHATDLAPGAFRKSRRIRLQRRIASVVVAAAALGIAVPAGSQILNAATGPDQGQVANTPTTTPEPKPSPTTTVPRPADVKPILVDFEKLPRGNTMAAWWDSELKSVRWEDVRQRLASKETPESFGALRVDGSPTYAMLTRYNEHSFRLDLVDENRARPVADALTDQFAISPDRKQVAYATVGGKVSVVSGQTGKTLYSKDFDGYPSVAGFAGNRVVLSAQDGERQEVSVWDLETDRVRTIEGALSAQSTAPAEGLVAVQTGNPGNGEEMCFAVVDVNDSDRRIWEGGCGKELAKLSPDGRHLVLGPPVGGEAAPIQYDFVDLATGHVVQKVQSYWLGDVVAWEADGEHFIVEAIDDNRNAVIRCGLSGGCELVSDPVRMTGADPYVVAIR